MDDLTHDGVLPRPAADTGGAGQAQCAGFTRGLPTGRSIAVRPCERRNPRRLGPRAEDHEVGHVVYRAYDPGGSVRCFDVPYCRRLQPR
jgi:hypothetical protein